MKRVTALLIALALLAGTVGCPAEPAPDPDPPVRYNLTIASAEGGSVTTPGEGAFTYDAGTVVSLVATPASGYRFVGWTGDVDTVASVGTPATTITINGDYSIAANFMAVYDLTVSSTEGGAVTTPGEGTFTYDRETTVSLVATPEAGYRFLNWSGDTDAIADPASARTSITMNDKCSVMANFAAGYATFETVLQGLSRPAIAARDGQGRIYFTEFDPVLNECRISRFDPSTGGAVQLIQHEDSVIRSLSLDGQGSLYYVLRHNVEPSVAQIRRLSPPEVESHVIFSIEETDQWIWALTADRSGNVYFALQSGTVFQFLHGSELRRIPAGTTTIEPLLVLQDSLAIWHIIVADDPDLLYFISDVQEVCRIYRFDLESDVLDTLLERTSEDFGRIAHLAARADGELYYLYRQRSDRTDPAQFGYLEIGRFTLEALATGRPPELLVALQVDRAVIVFAGDSRSLLRVSDSGDVFFGVVLYEEGLETQAPLGFFWFDPLTAAYVSLVESTMKEVGFFSFVLDDEGNLYYSAFFADTMVRINR